MSEKIVQLNEEVIKGQIKELVRGSAAEGLRTEKGGLSMARKSRKETAAVVVQEADATCRAAIYVRLSVEDTHTHSVSIETQQMIIARYLEQYPEISVYDTYIDNGATGTNFHRPGFQQMLSDIEAGHVNCVIVKDLSRLGRNTIDTGYYIEQYFRIRNIRFIAVNENFDTVAPEDAHSGIIIPLRNMINEAYIIPDHHPAIVEKAVFDTVQASQLRFSQPNKKKRDYPLKGKAFCGYCGHALSRTMQKTSYYYCRHSEADVESRCYKMRLNAAELEQAVFLTLKKQMEATAPLAPDGTLRVDASVPERAEYEQQIETLQDGKRTLYERYLMGEIDLNTYKAEKAAYDELLLKTKNAYAAVLAQAKQKQDEQARQDSRKEASKVIFDADTLTTELAELLIDRVLVYPDKRIEIAYKIQDIFD